MRSWVRFSFLAVVVSGLVAVAAPAAQAAVGIEKFVATNCSLGNEECAQEGSPPFQSPHEPSVEEAEEQGYTQAAGHVPFGITDFKITTTGTLPNQVPTGVVTHIRTDVAPGLATSPAAVPQCSMEQFGDKEAIPGTHFYAAPTCEPTTKIGVQHATVYAGEAGDVPLNGNVYNLVQREGLASEFGVALELPIPLTKGALEKAFAEKGNPLGEVTEKFLEAQQYFAHTLIEGNVEWGQQPNGTNAGDYHDYFEIDVSPALPLIRSRLVFFGRSGEGDFITNATNCPGNLTTTLTVTGGEGSSDRKAFTTPIGLTGCDLVPFAPIFSLTPATTEREAPDGITTELGIPRHPGATEIDSAQLKTAIIKLPEGMTLNPSAAAGLTACTPAQARIHSSTPGTDCPSNSELGTVDLDVPTLPPGSLSGKMYLGGPESGPITDPPYIVYLDAESTRYGVSVRLKGEATPDETTGQVRTVFAENPEQPFTNVALRFKTGTLSPIANPLRCGSALTETGLFPFTGTPGAGVGSSFTVDNDGKGGACPATLPFAPAQSTVNQTATAGGHTSFSYNLVRNDGDQYLSRVKTTLPEGLVGAISTVTPCTEAQAVANACPAASQIGSAAADSGSGPTPFTFGNGKVFLTGPYRGAPYGLSVVIPAIAGPFDLGPVTTRATLTVDPYNDRVTTTAGLPRLVKGIPVRLRGINVSINKQGFLYNPTNCDRKATDTTVSAFILAGEGETATQDLSSPFQVGNCSALKFKPSFKAASSARTSKANGASLETTVNQVAGDANIKSVLVQLPKALPSRLTTLQKACTEAQFNKDPYGCPSGSFVGGARANTPLLPSKLKGPAILVSHGGAAFPDLDLVLEANGVRTILVGNTDIKKGITTTNFATTPDVPVSSITVNLPIGSHSALAANTNLCANPLIMPTTITAQNGVVVKQNTRIGVRECGVRIVGHKVVGSTAYLTVQTFGAGRISGKGSGVATRFRKLGSASKRATLKVPLSRRARGRHRPFKVHVRVGFVPKAKGGKNSTSFVTLTFR